MRKKITYVAFDEKEFDTEMECREHEEKYADLMKVHRAINTIQNYCKENDCGDCPFYNSPRGCKFIEDTPNEWKV